MNTTITLSNAIIEAQSVTDIAKRLANAPTENGADGCDAGELSRNQLFGQYAYEYCMESEFKISAKAFSEFSNATGQDVTAYFAQALEGYVYAARLTLEREAEYWADLRSEKFPLSCSEIAQLDDSVALEHAVKLAAQEFDPDEYDGPDVIECAELSAAQSLERVAEIIGRAVGKPENEFLFSANELLGQYAYQTRMDSSNDYQLTEAGWAEFKNGPGQAKSSLTAYLENQLAADVEAALEMLSREGVNPTGFNSGAALAHAVAMAHYNWAK